MIKFLLNPFNLLFLLILAGVVFYFFKKRKYSRILTILSGCLFLVITTPLVPNLLLFSLENTYEPIKTEVFSNSENNYNIVVLGGGHSFDDRLPPNSLLSLQALARVTEGVRIQRQLPGSKLILSGYSASGGTTQAEMLQMTAILLGVEENDTRVQNEPSNTNEEANYYQKRFGDTQPVILVTSASHMPRAVGAFKRVGIEVTPSPTHYRIKNHPLKGESWIPSIDNISNLKVGMSEYAALARDRWLL